MSEVVRRRLETGADVDVLDVGDAMVFRVADMDRIAWPAQALFRSLDADALREVAATVPEGLVDADAGTLLLSFNVYVVRTPRFTALIDAGVGNGKDRADRPAWHRRDGRFLETLCLLGFPPQAFDIVVNTHLHADHVGWNTVPGGEGWRPAFPNARYVAPEAELAHWRALHEANPDGHVLHGAFADSVLPLLEAGRLEAVPAPFEIAPGLRLEPASGHSPGMCVLRLETGDEAVLFTADVLHHPLQFARPRLASNFCADPEMALTTRERLLSQNAGADTILAPYHFPSPAFGRVRRGTDGFAFVPLPVRG